MSVIGWPDLLEILLLAGGIYAMLRSLRGTRGLGILKGGVGFVVGLYVLSRLLERELGLSLPRLTFVIENLVTVALLAFVVIFQPEVRRALTRLGERPFAWFAERGASHSVSPVVEAAGAMSRRRIGALIVIERNMPLGSIIESGSQLAAEVSPVLLQTLFYPNSPTHDGAVIIRGSRIVAASCLLPLSDSPELGPEVGTRHRAAVGLTEEVDAIVVVVSEQTGRISVAHDGAIRPMRDTRELEATVNELLAGGALEPGGGAAQSESRSGSKSSIFSLGERLRESTADLSSDKTIALPGRSRPATESRETVLDVKPKPREKEAAPPVDDATRAVKAKAKPAAERGGAKPTGTGE